MSVGGKAGGEAGSCRSTCCLAGTLSHKRSFSSGRGRQPPKNQPLLASVCLLMIQTGTRCVGRALRLSKTSRHVKCAEALKCGGEVRGGVWQHVIPLRSLSLIHLTSAIFSGVWLWLPGRPPG